VVSGETVSSVEIVNSRAGFQYWIIERSILLIFSHSSNKPDTASPPQQADAASKDDMVSSSRVERCEL
jgi:hypothetical protein